MIELSEFSKENLIKELKERYNIIVKSINKVNKGSANIYKIISNDGASFILKEFQSKYSAKDVLNEINAIQYLKNKTNIPLPTYLKNNEGKYYFIYKEKTVIVQEFIDGIVINKNEGNLSQLLEAGEYLGKIINGFEEYKTDKSVYITDWFSKAEFDKAYNTYEGIILKLDDSITSKKIKEDLKYKEKLMKKLYTEIDINDIKNITHKISHGDYSCLQFIYNDEKKVKAILDFIKVKKLPIVWEIARSYSYTDVEARNSINIDNLVNYTKQIAKTTKLNKYDLKYLPYVYLVQLARSPYGYREYMRNTENKDEMLEFAIYRTDLCRDLEKKAKETSRRLLELI